MGIVIHLEMVFISSLTIIFQDKLNYKYWRLAILWIHFWFILTHLHVFAFSLSADDKEVAPVNPAAIPV